MRTKMKILIILPVLIALSSAQRPTYAGTAPIGYPALEQTNVGSLANRFGDGETTTMKLPVEARGDADLVRRLLMLPQDRQPFWLLNWKGYEEYRRNPQTYNQRPNNFIDPIRRN